MAQESEKVLTLKAVRTRNFDWRCLSLPTSLLDSSQFQDVAKNQKRVNVVRQSGAQNPCELHAGNSWLFSWPKNIGRVWYPGESFRGCGSKPSTCLRVAILGPTCARKDPSWALSRSSNDDPSGYLQQPKIDVNDSLANSPHERSQKAYAAYATAQTRVKHNQSKQHDPINTDSRIFASLQLVKPWHISPENEADSLLTKWVQTNG